MLQNARSHDEHLAVGVLGRLAVKRAGVPRALPSSRKTRGLLVYLALTPHACRREDLCDLLWDEGSADPRGELRWSLAKIRAAIGPWLQVSSEGVTVARKGLSIDADSFRDMAKASISEEDITEALALWRGPALADADVQGHHAFQAWLAAERESLSSLRRELATKAVDQAWGSPEAALSAARRLVVQEPWGEWGHARVAQSLERCGRLAEACTYVATVRQRLSRELGIPEARVLQKMPPFPATESAEYRGPREPSRSPRHVLRLEPFKHASSDDVLATLVAQATACLASAFWKSGFFALLDGEWAVRARRDSNSEADFALCGAAARSKNSIQFSLRCIDLRRGSVAWFERFETGRSCDWNFARLAEQVVEKIGEVIQTSRPVTNRPADQRKRLLTAQSLAAALQPAANSQALGVLKAILAWNADEPKALALAAWCYAQRAVYNWSVDPDEDRQEALRLASMATPISIDDAECLTLIGTARTLVGDRNGAEVLLDRALRLDPAAANAHVRNGWLANYLDRPARAARHFLAAAKLAPLDAGYFNCLTGLGVAHYIKGDNGQAIRRMEQALALNPKAIWIHRNLVPAYVAAGQKQKAEDGVRVLLDEHPRLTVAAVRNAMVFSPAAMGRIGEGLRSAGLPRA